MFHALYESGRLSYLHVGHESSPPRGGTFKPMRPRRAAVRVRVGPFEDFMLAGPVQFSLAANRYEAYHWA